MIDDGLGHSPGCLEDMLRFANHVRGKMEKRLTKLVFVRSPNKLKPRALFPVLEL